MTTLGALRVCVADTRRAEQFFGSVFGWSFHENEVPGHREVTVLGATGTEAEQQPPVDLVFTDDPREPAVRLFLSADDPGGLVDKIRSLGGRVESEQPSSDVVACLDDQATPLLVGKPVLAMANGHVGAGARGVLGVIFVLVADPDRAAAFYGGILGWRFEAIGRDRDILFLEGGPPVGLHRAAGARGVPTGSVTFHISVPDVDPVVSAIKALGGQVGPAGAAGAFITRPCVDSQGTTFSIWYEEPGRP